MIYLHEWGASCVGIQVSCSAGDNFAVCDGRFPVSKYSGTSFYITGHPPHLDKQVTKPSSNLSYHTFQQVMSPGRRAYSLAKHLFLFLHRTCGVRYIPWADRRYVASQPHYTTILSMIRLDSPFLHTNLNLILIERIFLHRVESFCLVPKFLRHSASHLFLGVSLHRLNFSLS